MSIAIGQTMAVRPPNSVLPEGTSLGAEQDTQFDALLNQNIQNDDSQSWSDKEAVVGTDQTGLKTLVEEPVTKLCHDGVQKSDADDGSDDASDAPGDSEQSTLGQLKAMVVVCASEISKPDESSTAAIAPAKVGSTSALKETSTAAIPLAGDATQETEKESAQDGLVSPISFVPASRMLDGHDVQGASRAAEEPEQTVQGSEVDVSESICGGTPIKSLSANPTQVTKTAVLGVPTPSLSLSDQVASLGGDQVASLGGDQVANSGEAPSSNESIQPAIALDRQAGDADESTKTQRVLLGSSDSAQNLRTSDRFTELVMDDVVTKATDVPRTANEQSVVPRAVQTQGKANSLDPLRMSTPITSNPLPPQGVLQVAQAASKTAANPVLSDNGTNTAAQPGSAVNQPLARQIGNAMAHLRFAPDGHYVFSARVHPEDLGPIKVTAHLRADGVHVELAGLTPAAVDALRGAVGELRHDLLASGIRSDATLSVNVDSGESSDASGHFVGGNAQNERTHGEPFTAKISESSIPTRGLEDMASDSPGRYGGPGHIDVVV
jgi:hypothetical protein